MSDKQPVAVKILDREYKIACAPEERRQLLDAADHLDRQMRSIKDGAGMVGVDKVAVLAALNITNEYLALKQKHQVDGEEIGRRIRGLREKLDGALSAEG